LVRVGVGVHVEVGVQVAGRSLVGEIFSSGVTVGRGVSVTVAVKVGEGNSWVIGLAAMLERVTKRPSTTWSPTMTTRPMIKQITTNSNGVSGLFVRISLCAATQVSRAPTEYEPV
jgi:hypothetical protein